MTKRERYVVQLRLLDGAWSDLTEHDDRTFAVTVASFHREEYPGRIRVVRRVTTQEVIDGPGTPPA